MSTGDFVGGLLLGCGLLLVGELVGSHRGALLRLVGRLRNFVPGLLLGGVFMGLAVMGALTQVVSTAVTSVPLVSSVSTTVPATSTTSTTEPMTTVVETSSEELDSAPAQWEPEVSDAPAPEDDWYLANTGTLPPDYVWVCESGGDYTADNNTGNTGKWQFDERTWAEVGGSGLAMYASPAEQDYRASLLWEKSDGGGARWTCF